MHLGGVLVLVGVILIALGLLTGDLLNRSAPRHSGSLVALGALLIGIGVLVGQTEISST